MNKIVNPLLRVPLNREHVFVMEKTIDGCEIYMPVNSSNDAFITQQKLNLKSWLAQQYEIMDPPPLLRI